MTGKTNSVGGKTYAVIDAIYPEGAACTCTNGSAVLNAKAAAATGCSR